MKVKQGETINLCVPNEDVGVAAEAFLVDATCAPKRCEALQFYRAKHHRAIAAHYWSSTTQLDRM